MAHPKASKATSPTTQPQADADTTTVAKTIPEPSEQAIDNTFAALKTLLNTVEKLQKARQTTGNIKPLLLRLLDGEMLSGEELEQLREGVSSLGKLVKIYSDYQDALLKAQPARELLDQLLKISANE